MTFDISADLRELGRNQITVVSAGAKSILDIGKTLEYLVRCPKKSFTYNLPVDIMFSYFHELCVRITMNIMDANPTFQASFSAIIRLIHTIFLFYFNTPLSQKIIVLNLDLFIDHFL